MTNLDCFLCYKAQKDESFKSKILTLRCPLVKGLLFRIPQDCQKWRIFSVFVDVLIELSRYVHKYNSLNNN